MGKLGWLQKPAAKPPAIEAEAEPGQAETKNGEPGTEKAEAAAPEPAAPEAGKTPPGPVAVEDKELVLGSLDKDSGYNLRTSLSQAGAGVASIELGAHQAERKDGQKTREPLQIIQPDPFVPPSFSLDLISVTEVSSRKEYKPAAGLDTRLWEVVRDAQGRIVRPVLNADGKENGQEVVFRATVDEPPLTITKTFRLDKGADGLKLGLGFASPGAERKVVYTLNGPHGLPIEGEWYTSVFREVFIGQVSGNSTTLATRLANDIVKKANDPERFLTLPLKFAGVENQYFAVFFEPDPIASTEEARVDEETVPTVVATHAVDKQKSDVSVAMTSRPVEVGPNHPAEQAFKIFAGPKTDEALKPYGAEDLATYRKSWWTIPGAAMLSRGVIAPLLDRIYALTANVSAWFGGKRGSYGIAIILLTITVRLMLFPLSRKQAISAKKMQDLQPAITALKEKYKDDKERFAKEQFALFKRHGVNPLGGCLLGIIQLPIFVGLWQALNNSVALRHAPFLWIDNLAAPDMLFKFPIDVPFLGMYFNLLPFAVMGLMLIQTKLFAPPATTPDQEMTQKMMKYMMVFMAFMFYKVPSGLGIYFITSSSWAICERLLLPKMIKAKAIKPEEEDPDFGGPGGPKAKPAPDGKGNGNGNNNGNGPKPGKGGWLDRLKEKAEQMASEASKDRTVRNVPAEKDRDRDRGNRPRPKPGRRR